MKKYSIVVEMLEEGAEEGVRLSELVAFNLIYEGEDEAMAYRVYRECELAKSITEKL